MNYTYRSRYPVINDLLRKSLWLGRGLPMADHFYLDCSCQLSSKKKTLSEHILNISTCLFYFLQSLSCPDEEGIKGKHQENTNMVFFLS